MGSLSPADWGSVLEQAVLEEWPRSLQLHPGLELRVT